MKTILNSFLAAVAAVALTATAGAQLCAFPDGLNGPCCAPVQPVLPAFPQLHVPGMGICWQNCNPNQQVCVDVSLSAPVQTGCAQYKVDLVANNCVAGGLPYLAGTLILDYTRNWDEMAPAPLGQYGVWRFAVKADLFPAATGVPPVCPVPSCLAAHPTAFYYGYLDYALNCQNGNWEAALVLYHACDKFIHDPLISSRPGVFHPNGAYALVAPATPANPFIPAIAPAPGGPIVAEAMRALDPAALACRAEEPVHGNIQVLGQACACPFMFVPPQVTARLFMGNSVCNSTFASVNLFPNFPWLHIMSTSIGGWAGLASYPGPEHAWVDEGPVLYTDGCTNGVFGEVHYGGTTRGGYQVLPNPISPVTQIFTDIANNYSIPLPGPIALPIVGNVMPTRHLIYVNVP